MQACAVGNFVMTQWDISPLDKKQVGAMQDFVK